MKYKDSIEIFDKLIEALNKGIEYLEISQTMYAAEELTKSENLLHSLAIEEGKTPEQKREIVKIFRKMKYLSDKATQGGGSHITELKEVRDKDLPELRKVLGIREHRHGKIRTAVSGFLQRIFRRKRT